MALRETVDNCGDASRAANPVLAMVDQFMGNKASSREKWMDQRMRPQMGPETASSSAPRHGPMLAHPAAAANLWLEQFEEAELAREMGDFALDGYGDPRMRPGMMPPHMRKGMPPGMPMEMMMHPRDEAAMKENAKTRDLWEQAYADVQGDETEEEMFKRFEHAYAARVGARPMGPPMPISAASMPMAQQRGGWANEFEQESRFAEFEQVYRQSGGRARGANTMPDEWTQEFEREYEAMTGEDKDMDALEDVWEKRSEATAQFDPKVAKESQILATKLAAIQDPKFRQSELFQLMSALSNGEIAFEGDKVVPLPAEKREAMEKAEVRPSVDKWASEFEEEQRPGGVWRREFEEEFMKHVDEGEGAYDDEAMAAGQDFAKRFANSWADEFNEAPLGEGMYSQEDFEEAMAGKTPDYELAEENSMSGDPTAFERGKALFAAGRLTEAIVAFEAAVKQNPENSLAWQFLGATQAENDRDDLASQALVKAIQADPNNRDALITLAVSFVNDYHKLRALECLQQWLATSEYADRIKTDVPLGPGFDQNHRTITEMFIQAARTRPEDPDPDVQIALGLLFNLTFEYELAIDCFKAAAMKRPDDYLVWNKLGATQANARNSEDAIDSFTRALEIKPTYTRACSNLGISFTALNEYGEAAKAFLSALSLNPDAKHQWDNLRNVFSLMKRDDLLKKCNTGDISLFMDEFHF